MALFESYERRIDKINSVLNSYGIASIEEAEKITKDAGLNVYDQVKSIQPICFRERLLGLHSRCCNRNQKAAEELLMLQQQSVKVFRLSVFRVLLLTHVK